MSISKSFYYSDTFSLLSHQAPDRYSPTIEVKDPEHFLDNVDDVIGNLVFATRSINKLIRLTEKKQIDKVSEELIEDCRHGVLQLVDMSDAIRSLEITALKKVVG